MEEVPFLPAAREEFLAAAERYEVVSAGLGDEFIAEVEHAVSRILMFPEHGSPYFAESRRVVLRRFPFDIVYLQTAEGVLVVAVAQQRRSPLYWRDRV